MEQPYQGDEALLSPHVRFAHHGVGLSRACLTVSKDADVVALEGVEQHLLPDVPVHPHLGGKAGVIGLGTRQGQAAFRTRPGRPHSRSDVDKWEEGELPKCGTSRSNRS